MYNNFFKHYMFLFFFSWSGRIHWGCEYNNQRFSNSNIPPSVPSSTDSKKKSNVVEKVLFGFKQPSEVVERLKPHYECIEAGGAGHKILCVFLGLVDVYVSSKASTYKWDTCAGNIYIHTRGKSLLESWGTTFLPY